jgi:hypothetical protein
MSTVYTPHREEGTDQGSFSLFACGARGICVCIGPKGLFAVYDMEDDEADEAQTREGDSPVLSSKDQSMQSTMDEEKNERVLREHK